MNTFYKYPRTPHLEGSRLQSGDEDLESVAFDTLRGRFLVVEEKLDGANSGIRFAEDGTLLLQSRGHYLDSGGREKQFALFKTWANAHRQALWELLGSRYILYGEWLYAKHTIFYDALPHYFFEFDILDTANGEFLSTERRQKFLEGSPVVSVPVLWTGVAKTLKHLRSLLGRSLYKSEVWRERLREICLARNQHLERVQAQTDPSDLMEGLYLKIEEAGRVVERYKFVRADFLQAVADSGSHWMDRPILPNQLCDGGNLFGDG